MFKRVTAILMAALLFFIYFTACTDRTPPPNTTTATSVSRLPTTAASSTTSVTTSATTTSTTTTTSVTTTDTTSGTTTTSTTSSAPELASWTVLEYLCGTDLETEYGLATANLEELRSAEVEDGHFQYIVQTGGTSQWHCGVKTGKLQRWMLGDGELQLLDEQPLSSMGNPETLSDFIAWGVENYPAQHYMLIIWDHGGGSISGVAFDELFAQDSLVLPELSEALRDSGVYLDIVGFDACLMATLETAKALAPFAGYMIASEEIVPGSGWDYNLLPCYLDQNPKCTPEDLAVHICDAYMNKCKRLECDAMATLSVVDLNRLSALSVSFDAMAREMESLTTDISTFVALSQSSKRAESYGGNTHSGGYANLVDLGDLIIEAQDVLALTAADTLDSLFDAVIYNVYGSNRAYANGLSVFYPLNVDPDICAAYARICDSTDYLRFISAVVDEWDAPAYITKDSVDSVSSDDYDVELETWISEDSCYVMEVTDGISAINQVLFDIYYIDYGQHVYINLGTDDDIVSDWDTAIFKDNFRGTWLSIDGCFCAPELLDQEDEYNLYSIPILLNGVETNLRVAYVWAEECYHLIGVYDGIDAETGMANREVRGLQEGDIISPIFECYDMQTFKMTRCILDEIKVEGTPIIEETALIDGDYLYQFELRDIFDDSYFSPGAIMTIQNGEITVSMES